MKLTLSISETSWGRAGYDDDGDPIFDSRLLEEQVASELARQLLAKFAPKITEWLRTFVEERSRVVIDQLVAEVIQVPFQPTNEYGEAKGESITLREHLERQCKTVMERRVYARSDPKTGLVEVTDGYRREGYREMKAWEAQVFAAASAAVPAVLNGAIAEAVETLRGRVKAEAATAFAKGVEKLLGLP